MKKIFLVSLLSDIALLLVIFYAVFLWLMSPGHAIPAAQQQVLAFGALFWIFPNLLLRQPHDNDDWAGQF